MAKKPMSRPPLWSLQWSIRRCVMIEIITAIIVFIIIDLFPLSWWLQLIVAICAAITGFLLVCLTFRFHTPAQWIMIWLRYVSRKNSSVTYDTRSYVNQFDGIGSIMYDDTFVSIIELFAPIRTPVFVDRGIAEHSPQSLIPLDAIIDALYQYDVTLDSIDIINIGYKQLYSSTYDQIYSQLVPESPAMGHRRTFVVIKLKPSFLLNSILKRGGGRIGMSKTLNIVTKRTLRLLREEGINAHILSQQKILDTLPFLNNHLLHVKRSHRDETDIKETWGYLEHGHKGFISTYAIDPRSWNIENQNAWWRASTLETAQIVRIIPAGQDVRDGAMVYGWLRYVTKDIQPVEIVETSGLRLLYGKQKEAASLVLFHCSPSHIIDNNGIHVRMSDDRFIIPIGTSGQYFGRTQKNKHVYLDLFATGGAPLAPRLQLKNLDIRFLMQIALRAVSVGGKVKVHTPDWKNWKRLIDDTGSKNIWLENDTSRTDATLVIYDRVQTRNELATRTIISVDIADHFPKNVTITITSPVYGAANVLHVELGDRIGVIHWTSSKAEDQYMIPSPTDPPALDYYP